MIETDIECGHTKATLYVHGMEVITYSHLNVSNFNDNFKDGFIQQKVKSI